MLTRRLVSAAFLVGGLLLLIYFDFWLGSPQHTGRPGLVLSLLAIICSVALAGELATLVHARGGTGIGVLIIPATAIMVAISAAPVLWTQYPVDCPVGRLGWGWMGMAAGLGWVLAGEMYRFDRFPGSLDRVARCGLILAYLGVFFVFLFAHRLLKGDNALGLISLIALITTAKMSDSAAYFVGKFLGRHKMAPRLSPGKTWEGFFGSFAGGLLGTAIVIFIVAPWLFEMTISKSAWWWIAYAVAVTVAAVLGDLAESLLKRSANTKDSGSWIPGMGGMLDVVDSIVFAAPVSFVFWTIGDIPPVG